MTKQNILKRIIVSLIALLIIMIAAGCNQNQAVIEESEGGTAEISAQQSQNGTEDENMYVVAHPPDSRLPCSTCDGGKLDVACTNCDGTGKTSSSDTNNYSWSDSSLNATLDAITSRCLLCNGSGIYTCYTCWGVNTVSNPEYKRYITSLIDLSRQTGADVFKVDGYPGMYLAFEYCFYCDGTGYDDDGYACPVCSATGIYIFNPGSNVNNGSGLVKPQSGSTGGGSSTGSSSTSGSDWSSSSQYQSQCIKTGCSAAAEFGSQYCSIHKDSLTYNQYCAEAGCYNPPASSSLYCGSHRP